MNPSEEPKLQQLMDEVTTPEDSESESESFSSDDDIKDPTYVDENESGSDNTDDSISHVSNDINETVSVDGDTGCDELSDDEWQDDSAEIPDFGFDDAHSGIQVQFENIPSAVQCFEKLWDNEIMDMIFTSMNTYAAGLQNTGRPHRKNSRYSSIKPIIMTELKHFLALCILRGQIKFPSIRKIFSMDPLYYCPVFHYTMSGRRFEQLLRCFSVSNKISPLLNRLLLNFRLTYYPSEDLSLDESLLLFRGRLSFRQYIKGKRARYGIKFYSLCTTDGYVLNLQIYSGKSKEAKGLSKLKTLVFSLMEPYLDRGHHIIMDNFYNSVGLSKKLLKRKTHTTGTLRSDRRNNPKAVTTLKLKKGEHKWQRCEKVNVSKWKDRRDVLWITTKYHPKLIPVKKSNRAGKNQTRADIKIQ
ncbi:hypothetical protein NQ314_006097 [Rhamnusium bicolor]|uniref:PiggyBac transposable element-derived protein domain-containing protein n=1 Tax=Rhamnusium bicolor TaxID=1586634 RepID=A0AAV8Z9W2_9CUCU|nr:hypothetical protein NQ314_006097 [Rhamnusium bicolor]